jgi:hypothetical protein
VIFGVSKEQFKQLAAGIDDVRCAVLEMLGEVIYVFNDDPLGPPPELLRVFCEDIEPESAPRVKATPGNYNQQEPLSDDSDVR